MKQKIARQKGLNMEDFKSKQSFYCATCIACNAVWLRESCLSVRPSVRRWNACTVSRLLYIRKII